ncbi:MAG TPA: DUF3054 family protein [Anaerolineae bacterium]
MTNRSARVVLLSGDIVMLTLFVFLGQQDHRVDDSQPLLRLASTAAMFAIPWVVTALLLGGYQLEAQKSWKRAIGVVVNGWLIAAPLGALARSFINGTGVILSPFLVVAILIGGAFLLLWRVIFRLLLQRRA